MMCRNEKDRTCGDGQSAKLQDDYNNILRSLSTDSQNYQVLKHLLRYRTITSMEAIQGYSITRLSGRIYDLRNIYGVDIRGRIKTAKNKFGKNVYFTEYYLGGLN